MEPIEGVPDEIMEAIILSAKARRRWTYYLAAEMTPELMELLNEKKMYVVYKVTREKFKIWIPDRYWDRQ